MHVTCGVKDEEVGGLRWRSGIKGKFILPHAEPIEDLHLCDTNKVIYANDEPCRTRAETIKSTYKAEAPKRTKTRQTGT
jgi:hypothetical protein